MGTGRMIQTDPNCFSIACKLAEMFGFDTGPQTYAPEMRRGLYGEHPEMMTPLQLLSARMSAQAARRMGWSQASLPELRQSDAYLVLRASTDPDAPVDAHITFEYRGKEYNYGPGSAEGYLVVDRIPLVRKGESFGAASPRHGLRRILDVEADLMKHRIPPPTPVRPLGGLLNPIPIEPPRR